MSGPEYPNGSPVKLTEFLASMDSARKLRPEMRLLQTAGPSNPGCQERVEVSVLDTGRVQIAVRNVEAMMPHTVELTGASLRALSRFAAEILK